MSYYERANFLCQSRTAIGSFHLGIKQATGRQLTFQLDCLSANVTLQGTNVFSFAANSGSLFTNITSAQNLTSSGLWYLAGGELLAYRLVINSVAGHVTALIGS